MKKLSKMLALLLAICMVISAVPVFALAEDAPAAPAEAITEAPAEAPADAVAPVEAAAPAVEAVAADTADEAAAPAVAPTQVQALNLAAAELQADEIFKPATDFENDEAAVKEGYLVKVERKDKPTYYFKTYNQYTLVAVNGQGATPGTITLLADLTITDTNSGGNVDNVTDLNPVSEGGVADPREVYKADDLFNALSEAFELVKTTGSGAVGNSTSAYTALGNTSTTSNSTNKIVLDLGNHTLTYTGNRNLISATQYGLTIQNGKIHMTNGHSRNILANGSTTGQTSNGDMTSAYKPTFSFKELEVYVTGGTFFSSYNWNPTITVEDCTIITATSEGAFQLNKANTNTYKKYKTKGGETDVLAPKATLTIKNSTIGSLKNTTNNAGAVYYNGYKASGDTSVYSFYSSNKVNGTVAISWDINTKIVYAKSDVCCKPYQAGLTEPAGAVVTDDNVSMTVCGEPCEAPHVRSYAIASYTLNDDTATNYTTLTDAILAAMNDAEATSTTPHGVVKLLGDVDLENDPGTKISGGATVSGWSGNGHFAGFTKALELNMNGHKIVNSSTRSLFFLTSDSPADLSVKIYDGTYLCTNTGGWALVASMSTTDDTTATHHVIYLQNVVAYSAGGSAIVNSYGANNEITLDGSKLYSTKNNAVHIGLGASLEQMGEATQKVEQKTKVTLKNGTILASGSANTSHWGLNIPLTFSSDKDVTLQATGETVPGNTIEIQKNYPQLIIDIEGPCEIFSNNAKGAVSNWSEYIKDENFLHMPEGFAAYEMDVLSGFALTKDGAKTYGDAKKELFFSSSEKTPEASYTTVAEETTEYYTLRDAIKAAANDPEGTEEVCGTITLLKDVTIEASDAGKWVGGQGNGLIANSDDLHKAYHLDLNKKTLTNDHSASLFMMLKNGYETITIENGTYIGNGARALVALGTNDSANAGADNNGQVVTLRELKAIVHGSNQVVTSTLGGVTINIEGCTLAHMNKDAATYCIKLTIGGSDATQVYAPKLNIEDSTLIADHSTIGLDGIQTAKRITLTSTPNPQVTLTGDVSLYTAKTDTPFTNSATFYNETYVHYDAVDPCVAVAKGAIPTIDDQAWGQSLNLFKYNNPGDGDFTVTCEAAEAEYKFSTFGKAVLVAENLSIQHSAPVTVTMDANAYIKPEDSVTDAGALGGSTMHFISLMGGVDLTIDMQGHSLTTDPLAEGDAVNMTAFMLGKVKNVKLTVKNGTIEVAGSRGIFTCGTSDYVNTDCGNVITAQGVTMKTGETNGFMLSSYADGAIFNLENCTLQPGDRVLRCKNAKDGKDGETATTNSCFNFTGTTSYEKGDGIFAEMDNNFSTITFDETSKTAMGDNEIIAGITLPEASYSSYVIGGMFDGTATVSLGENIRVNFYTTEAFAALGVEDFTVPENCKVSLDKDNKVRISSAGSSAKNLATKVTVVASCVKDGIFYADSKSATPSTQINEHTLDSGNEILEEGYVGAEEDKALALLAAATINYAGKAQAYFKTQDQPGSTADIMAIIKDRECVMNAIAGIKDFTSKSGSDETEDVYYGTSLTLLDEMTLNFYFVGESAIDASAFKLDDVVVDQVSTKTAGGKTYTIVTVPIDSTGIFEDHTVTVNGKAVIDSAAAYCQRQLKGAGETLNELQEVCDAILRYGKAADAYFKLVTE